MKSYDQSHDGFNLIGIILYLLKIDLSLVINHLIYLTFLINLTNQVFDQLTQPIFSINLQLNWRRHWLMICCFLKRTYIKGFTLIH